VFDAPTCGPTDETALLAEREKTGQVLTVEENKRGRRVGHHRRRGDRRAGSEAVRIDQGRAADEDLEVGVPARSLPSSTPDHGERDEAALACQERDQADARATARQPGTRPGHQHLAAMTRPQSLRGLRVGLLENTSERDWCCWRPLAVDGGETSEK